MSFSCPNTRTRATPEMKLAAEDHPIPAVLPFIHPLDKFYTNAELTLPRIEVLAGALVPEPFNRLLVHEGDMTPALEGFHRCTLKLEVLRREQRNGFYFREVVLCSEDDTKRVEFGAIKIFLNPFPAAARNEILAERTPLGTILGRFKLAHISRPKAYLRLESDNFINRALQLEGSHTLYGRRNTISTRDDHVLAEIVEILPPAAL